MKNPHLEEEKKRLFHAQLIQELRNTPPNANFYLQTFVMIQKIGQLDKAKKAKLFENDDWNDPDLQEAFIQKAELFLDTHVK